MTRQVTNKQLGKEDSDFVFYFILRKLQKFKDKLKINPPAAWGLGGQH